MTSSTLRSKFFWQLQTRWHLRQAPSGLPLRDTVRGLQRLFLADDGALLARTLQQVWGQPVPLASLQRLDIAFYQEGQDQRVWRAQATLADGSCGLFGIIVARAPGRSSHLTQRDFANLQQLYQRQPQYCARPYSWGMIPLAEGVAAYTVEWLETYKELVFEITLDGGIFLVNAYDAHQRVSPQESRLIWRCLATILSWYPELRAVNIQAGDFVGQRTSTGEMALKLTTARELLTACTPAEHIHALLGCMITASGYLSDGRSPFDRSMSREVFLHRMQGVLQRRFGERAEAVALQQWQLFQEGTLARQEDWLKEDCIKGMYERFRAALPDMTARHETRQRWLAYMQAVEAAQFPPSWWFPSTDIPGILDRLFPHQAS